MLVITNLLCRHAAENVSYLWVTLCLHNMVTYHMHSESLCSRTTKIDWTCAACWRLAQYVILLFCRISGHPRSSTIDRQSVSKGSELSRKVTSTKRCCIGRWVSVLF